MPDPPLSVLHYVSHSLPEEQGYVARTDAIAAALADRGHRVLVASARREPEGRAAAGAVARLSMPEESPSSRLLRRISGRGVRGAERLRRALAMARYRDRIRTSWGRPHVVHVHTPPALVEEARLLGRWFGAPLVYEVRGLWELSAASEQGSPADPAEAARADARASRHARRVVAICRGIETALVSAGVPREKLAVVPNGVDTSRHRPRPRDASLPAEIGVSSGPVFGCATHVRRLEGLDVIVDAWPRVVEALPGATFLLLGDGPHREALARKIGERGLGGSFRLLGRVPRSDVPRYYSILDAFVVPRLPEPVCETVTPLKPLEAMASGVPVVASDVGGLRETIADGETGILFRAGDPAAAAEACVRIGRDAGLRERLSRRARAFVEESREWGQVTRAYDSIYADCLGGSRSR